MTDAKVPRVPYERTSFVLAGLSLLANSSFTSFPRSRGPRVGAPPTRWRSACAAAGLHGLARALAGVLGLVAAGLVALAIVLIYGFLRGRIRDLRVSSTDGRRWPGCARRS